MPRLLAPASAAPTGHLARARSIPRASTFASTIAAPDFPSTLSASAFATTSTFSHDSSPSLPAITVALGNALRGGAVPDAGPMSNSPHMRQVPPCSQKDAHHLAHHPHARAEEKPTAPSGVVLTPDAAVSCNTGGGTRTHMTVASHQALNLARLPIPPPRLIEWGRTFYHGVGVPAILAGEPAAMAA